MHTVFVSHSHQDNELCDAFVEALRARGVDAWYDRSDLQVGHLLSTEIQRELQARSVFILLATPASVASYWVETELGAYRELAAHDRTRVIIPIIIVACELPLLLRAYKWIDAVDVPLDTVVDQLAPTIGFPTQAELAAEERARAAAQAAEQRRQAEEERRAERQRVALELSQARERRRARLTADVAVVGLLTLALLILASLLLSLGFTVLPRAVGLAAGVLAVALVVAVGLVPPLRRGVAREWRDARRGLSPVLSVLLTLAVVATALFVTKPTTLLPPPPKHLGYDFSYTYHAPTHTGGSVTIGLALPQFTFAPPGLAGAGYYRFMGYQGLWQSCLAQLPDLTLQDGGWRPDLCTQVPTVANGGESLDGKTTTFHIDSRAVWSDGVAITADDFLFAQQLLADYNIFGEAPYTHMKLTEVDPWTVEIRWTTTYGYGDYLAALATLTPVPLHEFATGEFAGVYNPRTGNYNTTLAQHLIDTDIWNTVIPVDDGPFKLKSFDINHQAILIKNPRFFSNFFHSPALDQITFLAAAGDFQGIVPFCQLESDMITRYRQGGLDEVDQLQSTDLPQLGGIPTHQVITSPDEALQALAFNQRSVAPNAQANGGTSIFADNTVRQAFVEALDRCAAVRAVLGSLNCQNPNLVTDELTGPPATDYDPTFHLPTYNPTDAAALMERAGYPVVDGIRRYKDGQTPVQLKLVISDLSSELSKLALLMQQEYARNLGIGVTIVHIKPSDAGILGAPYYQGGILATGAFDLLLPATGYSPDPLGRVLAEGGGWNSAGIPSAQNPYGYNWYGLNDAQVIAQAERASETLDGPQRAAVYQALQRYIAGLLDIVPLYLDADISLVKPTLCNFKKWPDSGLNFWNMADWYVAPTCP
jgi:peptide/nickel transport system substrate-binding protein